MDVQEVAVRRALGAATDDAGRGLRGTELALVLLRSGQPAAAAAAATEVLALTLPDADPSVSKALARRAQARIELGDMRSAREDLLQARVHADPVTQQSVVNMLESADASIRAGHAPVTQNKSTRKELRQWVFTWRKAVRRSHERSLLEARLRATFGVQPPRQRLRQVFLAWRRLHFKPGENVHRLQRRRQLAESFMRSHKHVSTQTPAHRNLIPRDISDNIACDHRRCCTPPFPDGRSRSPPRYGCHGRPRAAPSSRRP